MTGWPSVPLRNILRVRSEIIHPRDHPMGKARFVGLEHIEPHTGQRIGELSIKLEELTGRKARFHPGDIVYGYLRPYLNKVWVADFEGYCSVDQYVLQVDRTVGDPNFVGHFMRSAAYLSLAPIDATPGQLPRIRIDEILSVPFPCPTIDEQRLIAANLADQLAAVDEIRKLARARTSTAQWLRAALVEEAFASSLGRSQRRSIASIARIQTGYAFRSEWFQDAGVRLLRNANVGHGVIDWTDVARLPPELASAYRSFQLDEGDIVLSLDRPLVSSGIKVARLATADLPSLLLQRVARFALGDEVVPDYLYYFLLTKQFASAISAHDQSLGVPHVSPRQVGAAVLPLPSRADQRRVAGELRERLTSLDVMESAIRVEQQAIEALPASLLRRAFDGLAA